jgi:WD40 repeat protein
VWRPFVVERSRGAKYPTWAVIDGVTSLLYVDGGICVQLWVEDGAAVPVASYHRSWGCGPVAVSPDGTRVLLTGGDGINSAALIFRAGTKEHIEVDRAGSASAIAVSPQGAWWAIASRAPRVQAFGWDGRPLDGILLSDVDSDYFAVTDLVLSPDASLLVTADDGGISQSELGTPRQIGSPAIRAFDLTGPATERWIYETHALSLAISPDGRTVVAGPSLLVLDAATGEARSLFAPPLYRAAFLPDGRLLVLADGYPALCDLDTAGLTPLPGATACAHYLVVSPDGWFATAGEAGVVIWQPA